MSSNGTMANSSKKRKASELGSDSDNRTPKPIAKRPPKGSKNQKQAVEEMPFKPECPFKPSTKVNDDVYSYKEEIAPGFEVEYGVRPGLRWDNMRAYRNVRLQDYTFSVGTIVHINKQNPPPKSPQLGATDDEILKYDRLNFWVGRIADARAESDKHVFLRVYWLYWPEELPMGRQPYHGDRELVLSNAMDIVDAQTISGAAHLTYWDEQVLDDQYQDRFWRQTFDVSQLGKDKKGGLSELRKHCRCRQPYNPDRTMFQCKKLGCMTWNHEECLTQDALQRAWSTYEKEGTLDDFEASMLRTGENQSESSLQHTLMTPVRDLGVTPPVSAVAEQAILPLVDEVTNGVEDSSRKGKSAKKVARLSKPATPPWEGKLKVRFLNTDDNDDDSPVLAKFEEMTGNESQSAARSWLVRVNCLECGEGI